MRATARLQCSRRSCSGIAKDHPLQVVIDIPGNGTSDLPLPAGYEDGFSYITQVEYPGGQVPAECLEDFEWQMYRAPTELVVRLLASGGCVFLARQ
jgi:hypothetical protein